MKTILTFIILAFSFTAFCQYPVADFSSPRATMNYFLKTMKIYKNGDSYGLDLAIKSFNLSQLDSATRETSAQLAAIRLINTLDRIEYINVQDIPLKPKTNLWIYRKTQVIIEEETFPVEISISYFEKKKNWLFTPQTLETIALYEKSLRNKNVVEGVIELTSWKDKIKKAMPVWTGQKEFIILNGQWLGLLFVLFIGLLLEKIVRVIITARIQKSLSKNHLLYNLKSQKKLTIPIGFIIFSGFWLIAIKVLEFEDRILSILSRGGTVIFTVGCVVASYQFVDFLKIFLEKKAKESENKFDDILVPLITKTLKTFVVLVGIIFIGNSLTLDMKSIVAGMGIGGIAFALAAKDTISNIFGSLTVLLDRPFRIGDWVLIDGDIEGTVEEVGLRSTRIRTFYNSLITLPNGRLTNAHIDNYGVRSYRRLSTKLGVEYSTPPEKLEAFCEGIRQIIAKHPYTRKDYFHVYFNSFGNSALEVLLYVFWSVPDWSAELNEKHRLLMDILRLGNEMGVQFAFPTQTLHLYQETHSKREKTAFDLDLTNPDQFKKFEQTIQSLTEKNRTPKNARSDINSLS